MFSHFFMGIQQDIKLAILAPIMCAIFRYVFIKVYRPKKSLPNDSKRLRECYRYGFWWGMDFNAYVFLISMILVSIPAAFLETYYAWSDTVRIILNTIYMLVLYTAFMGKMIFYYHFHDIYNPLVRLGKNADKMNFVDIFFNQNHGAWILLGYIPYTVLCVLATKGLLSLPSISYPIIDTVMLRYAFNASIFIGAVVLFYFFRFGGTLNHRNKPEWDEVPSLVKEDMFLAKATVDDLVALEMVWKRPIQDVLAHTDEESWDILKKGHLVPTSSNTVKRNLETEVREVTSKETEARTIEVAPSDTLYTKDTPLDYFKRQAKGPRIEAPSRIFMVVGESYTQSMWDDPFAVLHLGDRGKKFRSQQGAFTVNHLLPAGMVSQPSITSMLAGIFDANLEINEKNEFWTHTIATSLPYQLKKLGYKTVLWYGGSLSWASLGAFAKAIGFDEAYGGPDICEKGAPATWLGVYDHIFLEAVTKRIEQEKDEKVFHFVYTTSNHGPYTIPIKEYGWDPEKIMPDAPEQLRRNKTAMADMGTYWYTEKAMFDFIEHMQERYEDALIIATGDHSRRVYQYDGSLMERAEETLREKYMAAFAMYHRDFTADMFAGNTIGGHMNILPTIIEAIAPKDFTYYALMPSFFEPIDSVVTPYHWLTKDRIGYYADGISQALTDTGTGTIQKEEQFGNERDAYVEVTGYAVRHPENLIPTVSSY